jgi:CSLREA domain-containing protein
MPLLRRLPLVALACALVALALPALASAHTFTVNSVADTGGAAGCEAVPETECTLRGAIQAADADPTAATDHNLITFDSSFDGTAGDDEILLTKELPDITAPVRIDGNSCEEPTAKVAMPCAGVISPGASIDPFRVRADDVAIDHLAIGGGKCGIEVPTGNRFSAAGDWIGMNLAGEAKGATLAGILLGVGRGTVIGQDGAGGAAEEETDRNVFANSKVGVFLFANSATTIEGNYIGVGPDGKTLGGLNVGIEAVTETGLPAEETVIGGKMDEDQGVSRECDGPCNVIATTGPGAVGIKLAEPQGQTLESPEGPTLIAGNYIGVTADGNAQVGEAEYDILAGAGGHASGPGSVTVGGPREEGMGYSPYRNVIDGGEVAIRVDHAEGFLAEQNMIGWLPGDSASTTAEAGPSKAGFELSAQGVADPPVVAQNVVFPLPGAIGVLSTNEGSKILVNQIYGGLTAILAAEEDGGEGNLIKGNLILKPEWFGIEVGNDSNVLVGNWMFQAGRAGIVLGGENGVYASHNRIGGDTFAEENRIEECPEGAIIVSGEPSTFDEVAGNWGTDPGHPFIQLIGHHAGEPPNGGIEPPTIEIAEETRASGTAEPGAKVRLSTKLTAEPGELQSMIGTAVADSSGHWTIAYTEPIEVGKLVAATQTVAAGTPDAASSEVSAAKAAVADAKEGAGGGGGGGGTGGDGGSGGSGGSGEPGSGSGDSGSGDSGGPGSSNTSTPSGSPKPAPAAPAPLPALAPKAKITASPAKSSTATTAKFKFKASNASGAKFECKLDAGKWAKCPSPKTLKHLKPGRHTFSVRAVAAGLTGPVTKYRFTVKA